MLGGSATDGAGFLRTALIGVSWLGFHPRLSNPAEGAGGGTFLGVCVRKGGLGQREQDPRVAGGAPGVTRRVGATRGTRGIWLSGPGLEPCPVSPSFLRGIPSTGEARIPGPRAPWTAGNPSTAFSSAGRGLDPRHLPVGHQVSPGTGRDSGWYPWVTSTLRLGQSREWRSLSTSSMPLAGSPGVPNSRPRLSHYAELTLRCTHTRDIATSLN